MARASSLSRSSKSSGPRESQRGRTPAAPWTFLTNHAHVLLCIVRDPAIRLRDVAEQVGVTERAVQRIVTELEDGGYLRREREGRCNRYEVDLGIPLRHPIERHCPVADLVKMVLGTGRSR